MRKVWSTLVILAILVGMFVCLGAQASAEEGPKDLAVVAVANESLTAEHIDRIKESMPGANVLVIDVNGVDGDGAGYNYGYSDFDQGFAPDNYSFIWPGMDPVPTMEVTDEAENHCKVVLLPIGPNDTVETINAAVDGYKAEGGTVVVIAIAPESCYNVQAAVDSNVDKVLTCGVTEISSEKLVVVGGDDTNPVSVITVDELGYVNPITMPLPEAVDPGVGAVEEDPGIADMLAPGLPVAPTEETDDSGEPESEPTTETTGPETPEAETYKVYYDGNGNDVGTWMPDPEVEAGAYTLADNEYTKAGYEFAGWQIQGEDTVYGENDTIDVESDITVVAQWTETAGVGGITFTIVTYESGVEGLEDVQGAAGANGKITLLECPGEWTYEGHAFEGWKLKKGEDVIGDLLTAGTEYAGDAENGITFVAQWKEVEPTEEPEPTEPSAPSGEPVTPLPPNLTEVTVTYKYNEETAEDTYMSGAKVNLSTFADCAFTAAPEGQKFKAWKLGETEYAEGAEYTLGSENVTFEAVFEPIPAESFTVTFDANGGTGIVAAMTAAPNGEITLPGGSALTAPANKGFAGWKIGEQVYQANAKYTVTADVTAYAQWNDLQSAGHVDTLKWTQGGTDALVVTYAAPIATISMDGVQLTAGSHYQLSNNNMTAQFYNDYLNGLAAGNHTIVFTFGAAAQNGVAPAATYANETVTLSIAAPAVQQPATAALEYTWADRNQPLVITLTNETPVALQIDYGSNGGYKTPQGNTNYTVSGNTLTLQPDLVNKNNGGVWPAGRYGFKIITSSGNNPSLQVTLTSNTVNNTSTTTGGTSPVTGDTNNVVLYVVLLAVLVVALVVVLVVLVKRRNSGRR